MGWAIRRIRKYFLTFMFFFVVPCLSSDLLCQNIFFSDPMGILFSESLDQYKKHILNSPLYEPLTQSQSKYLERMLDFQESESAEKRFRRTKEWEEFYIAERHSMDALGLLYDPYWRSVRDLVFIQWSQAGMASQILSFFEVIPPSLNQVYLVRKNINPFLSFLKSSSSLDKFKHSDFLKLRNWLLETEMFVRLDLEYQLLDEGASRPEWPQFVTYLVGHIQLKDIDAADCKLMLKRLTQRLRPIQFQLPEVRWSLIHGMSDILELLQRPNLKKMERLSLEKFLQEWILSLPLDSFQKSISPLENLKKSANLDQDLVSRIEKLQTWLSEKSRL